MSTFYRKFIALISDKCTYKVTPQEKNMYNILPLPYYSPVPSVPLI